MCSQQKTLLHRVHLIIFSSISFKDAVTEIFIEFITEHLQTVSKQHGFQQLPSDIMIQLVQSTALKLSLR